MAELVAPNIDNVINRTSITLRWTANNADNNTVIFDVYLDTISNPVTKVSENQTETILNITSLTTYYFKVAVKDYKVGVAIG